MISLLLQLVVFRSHLTFTKGQISHIRVVQRNNFSESCPHCFDHTTVPSNVTCCFAVHELPVYQPLSENLKVVFESNTQTLNLSKLITFVNLVRLEIRNPRLEEAVVKCLGKNVGFKFDNISILKIENITFETCGAKHRSSPAFTSGWKEIFFL